MADRLTRWQWARSHAKPGWREAIGAALAVPIYAFLSYHYGFGRDMRPEVGAAVAALGAGLVVYLTDFGWQFARAHIEQDRRALTAAVAQNRAMRAELDALTAQRTAIQTKIEGGGNDWFVVVRNLGANGAFRAQIRILDAGHFTGASKGICREGYWEGAGGREAFISSGFQDRLRVGAIRHTPANISALVLYVVGAYQGPDEFLQDWMPVADPGVPKPELFVEITISSEPPLREPFVRYYRLDFDSGFVESLPPGI